MAQWIGTALVPYIFLIYADPLFKRERTFAGSVGGVFLEAAGRVS
jgi:hypothetical protein